MIGWFQKMFKRANESKAESILKLQERQERIRRDLEALRIAEIERYRRRQTGNHDAVSG